MSVRSLVAGAAVAGLVLAMAACSSGSKSSGGGGGPSGTSATPGSAGQLAGSQLTRALLPAADFPSGFIVDAQSTTDSGGKLETPQVVNNINTLSCNDFDNDFLSGGFGEVAYSSDSVTNSSSNMSYGQIMYEFPSTSAASGYFNGVKALGNRCGSYTQTGGGSTGQMSMKIMSASPVNGDQTFWLDRQTTISGTTAQANVLFALDGATVVGIAASGIGAAPPSNPSPTDLLGKLITSLSAQH
jgi:hypothetical protein